MIAHEQAMLSTEQYDLQDDGDRLSGTITVSHLADMACLGGIRFREVQGVSATKMDGRRLALCAAYRNVIADLPFGGGVAVLDLPTGANRRASLKALGRAIDALVHPFIVTNDMGASTADLRALGLGEKQVAGLPPPRGRPGGDPSPWTALSVFLSMRFMAETQLHRRLRDCTVAIQGVGRTGGHLARLLHRENVRLVIADTNSARVARVASVTGADVAPTASILSVSADILAPCAIGGILSHDTIGRVGASVICGAADAQLATPEDGARLADAGIPYAPDYVVNAGGAINAAAEMLDWTEGEAIQRICSTPQRLDAILDMAAAEGSPASVIADRIAAKLIGDAAAGRQRSGC